MITAGNIDGKWSEKKMEGEDGLRTLDCLRGRLLAERGASRIAKEDEEQMGNKLIELENQLREENKSRNRAEKKLKFLLKKLESMNISYASDESNDISSVSSTACSSTREPEDKEPKNPITKCDTRMPKEKIKSPVFSENLNQNVSESSQTHKNCHSNEDTLSSTGKPYSEESSELEPGQSYYDLKKDDYSLKSSVEDNEINEEDGQDDYVDNSLALVPVDLVKTPKTIDPVILDATVKDVLDALRHAKERLQCSMERRHTIRVGSR